MALVNDQLWIENSVLTEGGRGIKTSATDVLECEDEPASPATVSVFSLKNPQSS